MTSSPDFRFRFISTRDGTRLRTAACEALPGVAARGVCVLLQGQSEFIEKYGDVIGELGARGFTVVAFDWRGQGGSQRLLADPLKSHVQDFAQFDDDLASVLDEVVRPLGDRPPLVLAHSMGAQVLLRALHDRPHAFAAAAMTAPMIAFSTRGHPPRLTRLVTAAQCLAGRGGEFAWGMAERDPFRVDFGSQLVTSDRGRFARTQEILRAHPDLRLAGPTWRWLEAAYRSIARVNAAGFAEAIRTPVLVAGPGKDRISITDATRDFVRRLANATYLELPDSEHEILMEADPIRAKFWAAFDGFVEKIHPSP